MHKFLAGLSNALTSSVCCVITADCDSPVNFERSLSSYSDADDDDDDDEDLDFPPLPVTTLSPSLLQHRHGQQQSSLVAASHGAHGHSDMASYSSVCAPILVVPSSDSFISLICTPDSSPDRPPMFSPSQVSRYSQSIFNDLQLSSL